MNYKEACPCCGHQETAYAHNMNKGLASAFSQLCSFYYKTKRGCSLSSDLDLTHNQLANFQKLRYFGLVFDTPEGWFPTELGLQWFKGETPILNPAGSLSNKPLPGNHKAWDSLTKPRRLIHIYDIISPEYRKRSEYKAEKSRQSTLL